MTDMPAVQRPTPTPTGTDARRSAFLRVGLIQTMLPRPGVPVTARTAQAQELNSASLVEVDLPMLARVTVGSPGSAPQQTGGFEGRLREWTSTSERGWRRTAGGSSALA